MKKTIVTVFSIIIVLVVMGIITNVVTSGAFFRTIIGAVAKPINTAWQKVTGDSTAELIPADAYKDIIKDENNLTVFD